MEFLRAFYVRSEGTGPEDPIRFVASTEGVKSDGIDLRMEDWSLERYLRHPVVLYAHDFMGRNLPIGTGKPFFEERVLMIDVSFDTEDDFAMRVRSKTMKGMMGGSVSWDRVSVGDEKRNELLEFSVVPVPLDPNSLPVRQKRGVEDWLKWLYEVMEDEPEHERNAIPPHSTEKASEDTVWDGPAQVAQAEGKEQLRRIHAWVDDEMDQETKQAYKLPHHLASGECVWRGVAAAMSRLLQAGTQIPDEGRRGVYNHLARHYEQFDREPPEFRTNAELAALTPELRRGLFLEGEPEMFPELFAGTTGNNDQQPAELQYLQALELRLRLMR